jgi:hypothetical protein
MAYKKSRESEVWKCPNLGGKIDGNLERSGVSNIGVIALKF